MPKVIVSTCGTSLLTNNPDSDLRKLLMKTANYQEKDFLTEEKRQIDHHINNIQAKLTEITLTEVKKISAELNGILTYYQDRIFTLKGTPDTHFKVSECFMQINVSIFFNLVPNY